MTETEFDERVRQILDAIETQTDYWYEVLDVDIDIRREANVLNMLFENSIPVVINSQAPLQEIWVAARAGGFHYRMADDQHWKDTRDGSELFAALSRLASAQAGAILHLNQSQGNV